MILSLMVSRFTREEKVPTEAGDDSSAESRIQPQMKSLDEFQIRKMISPHQNEDWSIFQCLW